jgi:hypothetical protein
MKREPKERLLFRLRLKLPPPLKRRRTAVALAAAVSRAISPISV